MTKRQLHHSPRNKHYAALNI